MRPIRPSATKKNENSTTLSDPLGHNFMVQAEEIPTVEVLADSEDMRIFSHHLVGADDDLSSHRDSNSISEIFSHR